MCYADDLLETLVVQDVDNLSRNDSVVVRFEVFRMICVAVAEEIRYDGSIALILDLLYLVMPVIA
jgi:hypothetical protein